MPSTNPLRKYSNLAEASKVKFKAGSQATINTMMTNGTAEEGTFYLTNDTHKLYVGRKNSTDNKIYPEQVSRGVTVVDTSANLPSLTNVPEGAIEEGELYYITDTNVLAALRKKPGSNPVVYEWVQINPPTAVTDVATAAVENTTGTAPNTVVNSVDIRTTVSTQAGDETGAFRVKAGDNISLAGGNESISIGTGSEQGGYITINAVDTLYAAHAATNTSKGVIGLQRNSDTGLNSSIDIVGTSNGWTKVESSATNDTVTIKGPVISDLDIANHTTDGFVFTLEGTKGDGTAFSGISGTLAPTISYGQDTPHEVSHFANGDAYLDIYTADETDAAIEEAINDKLATANAMTYKGIVTSADDLRSKIIANGGAHNGDVYKVGSLAGSGFNNAGIGGVIPETGDLIIISGTEETTGTFAGQIKVGDTGVTGTAGSYTATSAYTLSGLLGICDLVPSGDEPHLAAGITTSASRLNSTSFQLYDDKHGDANILKTNISSGDDIAITSTGDKGTISTGEVLNISVAHNGVTRTDTTNATLTTSTAADTIGTNKVSLFVLDGATTNGKVNGIKTSATGHVTGIEGKIITFQHNRLTTPTTSYGAGTGVVQLSLNDTIGSGPVSTTIKYVSNTLSIGGTKSDNQLSNPDQLNIDLLWGTF